MQNNLKQIREPKVYALILESLETVFLSIQYTYSLEEAFILAKLEFEKQNPLRSGYMNPFMGSKIGLFTVKTVKELTAATIPLQNNTAIKTTLPESVPKTVPLGLEAPEVQKIKLLLTQQEKNVLMKEIIEKKDAEMFEKNKTVFSDVEIKYLKGKLS